jgi:hypothetical protein
MAGGRWVTKFLKGHKNLSLYKTEATQITIAVSFNKAATDAFSDILKEVPHRLHTGCQHRTTDHTPHTELCTSISNTRGDWCLPKHAKLWPSVISCGVHIYPFHEFGHKHANHTGAKQAEHSLTFMNHPTSHAEPSTE